MIILIDSDILIEVTRGKDTRILNQWRQLQASQTQLLYSPVSAAELWAGAWPSEREVLENLFDALVCASVDSNVGTLAGQYMNQYMKSHRLELGDALIAATTAMTGASLWTRNRKHYPMPGLKFFPS